MTSRRPTAQAARDLARQRDDDMTETLEKYLRDYGSAGVHYFELLATRDRDGRIRVTIHPANEGGLTLDFTADGNCLNPCTSQGGD